jgi:hypothetical protein
MNQKKFFYLDKVHADSLANVSAKIVVPVVIASGEEYSSGRWL